MGVSVTSRVLDVLAAFSAHHPALTLSELSRRAGLPLTTTHRIVGELTTWGALERDAEGRYRVGVRLWEIAALAPRAVGLRESAMPFLEDVYETTRQNVQLAVLDGPDVLYLERLSARGAVSVISRVGGRLPVHATGVGQVLLAHADPAVQERVLAAPLPRLTPHTITSPRELRRVLAEIRRDGYVVADRQVENHSSSVAAPVHGPDDTVVAALSVVVPAGDVHSTVGPGLHHAVPAAAPYVAAVRSAARGISRVLGAPRARHRPTSANP
jgi:DNA-binding IclR family transcriptional regulator